MTESSAHCPVCTSGLLPHAHESVTIQACPTDHGVFLDSESLRIAVLDRAADRPASEEQAAEAAQGPIAREALEAETVRPCPVCRTAMTKQVYAYQSGVVMDVCAEHGIWLDAGELEQIEAWYEAQEAHRAGDTAEWGGRTGKLEQIEETAERRRAEDVRNAHWGPVGWFAGKHSWWVDRRDDR